jgi:RNA polymerase sigma factor (sigma-70 family)
MKISNNQTFNTDIKDCHSTHSILQTLIDSPILTNDNIEFTEDEEKEINNLTDKFTGFDFDLSIAKEQIKESRRKKNGYIDPVQMWAEKFKETHDIQYWNKIYKRLWPGLVNHCYKVTKNKEIAEDVASVIMTRAYDRIDDYDILKAKFGTWVWCIGFRQACRDLTLERRQPVAISSIATSDETTDDFILSNAVHDPLDGESSQDVSLGGEFSDINNVETEYANSVDKLFDASLNAISSLKPALTQQVVTLKLIDNKTIAEISEMLSMTPSNVKNHLYKGKRMVAESIKNSKDTSEIYNTYIETNHIISA